MKQLKEKIKKYWKALLILGSIILLMVIWLAKEPSKEITPPIDIREPPEEKPISRETPLEIVDTSPESGTVVKTLADTIVIEFDEEINVNTLRYSVEPDISLQAETFGNKKELQVFPNQIWWEDNLTYTLTISYLEGMNGEKLQEPIIYEYTRSPDEDLPLGDPPPQPGESFE